MKIKISGATIESEFVKKIQEISGEDPLACYQCGKCSAGCPSISAMDVLPNQIVRQVQLGLEDEIPKCETIWLCASCQTCAVRCPRGVDLARIMEALRQLTLRKNENRVEPSKLPKQIIEELPQIALISNFRKMTA